MYKKLLNLIKESEYITIYRHVRPDGDAAFSSIALYYFLKDNFKDKKIKLCGEGKYDKKSINHKVSDSFVKKSLAIVLDTASKERADDQRFLDAKSIVKIDHHPALDNYGSLNIVVPEASATCELLANILLSKDFSKYNLSKKVAYYLYCGIVTDTINFKTSNTSSNTFKTASKLIEIGQINVSDVNEWLMNVDLKTFNILTKVRNKLVVENRFGYILLNDKDIKKLNMSALELKNHISEIGNICDLNVWAFAVETQKGSYDCSYRSKRKYVINEICRLYGGGGHKNAAATKNLSLDKQKEIFNKLIELSTK